MSATHAPAFTRLDPDGRRRQIVDAARAVFSERPYASVSMSDVARAAGVTRGLIHHYFGSKHQLFGAVLQSLAERAPALVTADQDLPIEEVVAVGVDAWLEFVGELRELALTVGAAGMYPDDPELLSMVHAAREEIVRRIILNLHAEEAPPREIRLLIRGYLGLADAAAREWLFYERSSRAEVRVLLTSSLLALLRDVLPALSR